MTATSNKGYTLPVIGGDTNTWGAELNANLALIDSNLGGTVSINCVGASDVTLNSTQASNLILSLTGLLTGNIAVKVPQTGSFYIVRNGTSGSFTVTVKTSNGSSAGVIVPQGSQWFVGSDGTNVSPANWDDGTQFYGTDSGTASALAATLRIPVAAYFDGLAVTVKVANVNTAGATLNINTIGAKPIYVPTGGVMATIGASVTTVGQDVQFVYDTSLSAGSGGWQVASAAGALSNVAYTNVNNNFTADQTIVSTDSGAAAGPNLNLSRNSVSPVALDLIGSLNAIGKDSGGNDTTYATLTAQITDPTDGSEDSAWLWTLLTGGASLQAMSLIGGTLEIPFTDAGASGGPIVSLYRISSSPAANDALGQVMFYGRDTNGNKTSYAAINGGIITATDGAEVGQIALAVAVSGTLVNYWAFRDSILGGTATGGFKGAGTINISGGYYVNGVRQTGRTSYYGAYTTNADLSTIIPLDNSTPLSTEGTQVISLSVTTTSATQKVRLRFQSFVGAGSNDCGIAALFRSTTCLSASVGAVNGGPDTSPLNLELEEVPGSAATFTYSIRVGGGSGTVRLNGTNTARLFGGVATATLIADVWEP